MGGVRLLAFLILAAMASPSALADGLVLWVENRTGVAIHSLHLSPVESSDWEEDVLGDDLLEDGERVEIQISGYDEDQCFFDLLATNPDGMTWVLPRIDLCEIFAVTVTPRHRT